jgi:nitronate monooxygenase
LFHTPSQAVRVRVAPVGSADDAKRAVDCGVEYQPGAQGWEAGGHVCGMVATMPLVPMVVDAVGRDACGRRRAEWRMDANFAAALALGAAGAWIGTRFLASDEAVIHPRYRELLLRASETDTVYLDNLFDVRWPNAPHRVLRNKTVEPGRPRAVRHPSNVRAKAR